MSVFLNKILDNYVKDVLCSVLEIGHEIHNLVMEESKMHEVFFWTTAPFLKMIRSPNFTLLSSSALFPHELH